MLFGEKWPLLDLFPTSHLLSDLHNASQCCIRYFLQRIVSNKQAAVVIAQQSLLGNLFVLLISRRTPKYPKKDAPIGTKMAVEDYYSSSVQTCIKQYNERLVVGNRKTLLNIYSIALRSLHVKRMLTKAQ